MSFFDDDTEDPRPTRRSPRGGGSATVDPQTLMVRRAVAAGVVVIILIIMVLGVRGCLDSRKKDALRDYNRDVESLITDSDRQIGRALFRLLDGAQDADAIELQTQVNSLRGQSEELVDRARGLDAPDEVGEAQGDLVLVLVLRRDAVGRVAERLPAAKGDAEATQAVRDITAQMQAFLASDVVYSQRVAPLIREGLDDADVKDTNVTTSQFLPDLSWLEVNTVADRLGAEGVERERRENQPPAPGLHGHALSSVSVGDTRLNPDGANRITAGADLAFTVAFQNGGENDEFDVPVEVRISGSGRPTTIRRTAEQTKAGTEASVDVPLDNAPPIGQPVEVKVTVGKVPGEDLVDNNTQTYQVLFQR